MRWALLSLWLLGAGLYAAIAFTSSHSDRAAPPQSAAIPLNTPASFANRQRSKRDWLCSSNSGGAKRYPARANRDEPNSE